MAKKKSEEEDGQEKKKGKGKMIILIVVGVLVGVFIAKTFLLKPAALTAEQMQAAKDAVELTLLQTCAAHNNLEIPTDLPEVPGGAKSLGRGGLRVESLYAGRDAKTALAVTTPSTMAHVTSEIGPLLPLDARTVNLADGHYLKIGLALQLPVGAVPDEIKITENWDAIAQTAINDAFINKSMDDVLPADKRLALLNTVGNSVCTNTEAKVFTVYFTDYVAQ